ncbi:MAG: CoA transferase [Pseudolabrys sp.]
MAIATYGTFPAKDGVEVVIAAVTERMWTTLCEILGCEELTSDPRFITADDRKRNRPALIPLLEQRFLLRPADEWMALFDRRGVPVGVVNTLDRVMADPQIVHRGMVTELASGDGRRARVIGDPIFFKEAARPVPHYPPPAGADSAAILKDVLGLGDAEVKAMIENGVVTAKETSKS